MSVWKGVIAVWVDCLLSCVRKFVLLISRLCVVRPLRIGCIVVEWLVSRGSCSVILKVRLLSAWKVCAELSVASMLMATMRGLLLLCGWKMYLLALSGKVMLLTDVRNGVRVGGGVGGSVPLKLTPNLTGWNSGSG